MNLLTKPCILLVIFTICLCGTVYGKVVRESCKDFIQVSIKGIPVNFDSEMETVTQNNLKKVIVKTNNAIGRRNDLIDPNSARKILARLYGIGLYRLGGGSLINCCIVVDNASHRLMIIDSRNNDLQEFKICGPMIRRKSGFPWFRITWECTVLWSYSCSKLKSYGEVGNKNGQFSLPTNIVSDAGDQTGGPINLWIADSYNSRISHLRYTTSGTMSWINKVGRFYEPVDLAYKHDKVIPTIYIADKMKEQIVRIPITDSEVEDYRDLKGHLVETGFVTDLRDGFSRPTGICLNRSGDRDGWVNSITYVYVADAGNQKVYRFMEAGSRLQYLNSVSLPPLSEERRQVGIRSDRFGTIYVFDESLGKVLIFSPSLEKIGEFGSPGDHSSTDIKFTRPGFGYITGDNLFVSDGWACNSGIQRFNIGGIDIVSASVDYVDKTASIVADNAFDQCIFYIDDSEFGATTVTGTQYSGTFSLDLSSALSGLAPGQHSLTISLRSAHSASKTCTKTIKFIADPNADRQPRNIKIKNTGRRVDISWEAPSVYTGLSGYTVYANDNMVHQCDAFTHSYSYYASRQQAGATIQIKLGALFEQEVEFSNVTNFAVYGNSLEQYRSGEAAASSVQQLSQSDWNSLPLGTKWIVSSKLDVDPTLLSAEPLMAIGNTPIKMNLLWWIADPLVPGESRFNFIGWGGAEWRPAKEGDKIDLIFKKITNSSYYLSYRISGTDGQVVEMGLGNQLFQTFPLTVNYHSNTPGVKLTNCTIGYESTMSSNISVPLRTMGDVVVDGSTITLDDAVTTAFNGDNLKLSNTQYTLSVPLNEKPGNDLNETPVSYTITGAKSQISYSGPETLIATNVADVQNTYAINGVIFRSPSPVTIFSGASDLTNCAISFTMQNSVLDAPVVKIIENTASKPIPAGSTASFNLNGSTFTMGDSDGFITLLNFTGLTMTMTDNLVYQRNQSDCFCFANTGAIDICPMVTMTNNSFILAQVCTGCEDKICNPTQNIIASAVGGTNYLNSDYGVTNIDNPGVIKDPYGTIVDIIGANKTINDMEIADIINPKLTFWPNLFTRTNPNGSSEKLYYLPLSNQSQVNISMNSRGNIYSSLDILFTSPNVYNMMGANTFLSRQVAPTDLLYCYGQDNYGLTTDKYVLSFPGNVVFDEQLLASYYGANTSSADVFVGKTSSDAASGSISWNVESLPIDGNPANGYYTQRTESFFEPLPDVTGCETFTFQYKKQYPDQIFSITFQDSNGTQHSIQNAALPSGTRGWYLSSDASTLSWQQAQITIRNEENLPIGEMPMNGKLIKLSIHHQSASASTAMPVFMLFDALAFQSADFVIFDEQDPAQFVGKGGVDGWSGLTSTDAFTGTKSFEILIPAGSTNSTDEWTGPSAGTYLPLTGNLRKITFAYKKTDPNSHAAIKLHIKDIDTDVETDFEISEQNAPADMVGSGWPIPCQQDMRWHQVFIDLFSVKGPGNTTYSSTNAMPFGKLAKIELCLTGVGGASVLFDNIKFVQEFYNQTSDTEQYTVSPDYSEAANTIGWKINALSEVYKNTIISYGADNCVSLEENYNLDLANSGNTFMIGPMEIEKNISFSGADFQNLYIQWQEHGDPIGFITCSILCSNGKTYPLTFSPCGYLLNNSRGIFNLKQHSDQSTTKHWFKIVDVFNQVYPELVNAPTPVTAVSLGSAKVQYQSNEIADWYSRMDYPYIDFCVKDATPFTVSLSVPEASGRYGIKLPVALTANKEIASIKMIAKKATNIVGQWKRSIGEKGQTTFTGFFDLAQLTRDDFGPNGMLTITVEVTDVFGETLSLDRAVEINRDIPNIVLHEPTDQFMYNGQIPLYGVSDQPLQSVTYTINDLDGTIIKAGVIEYSTEVSRFDETVTLDPNPPQKAIVWVYATAINGQNSQPVARNLSINPSLINTNIGTVTNPNITWDANKLKVGICAAGANIGGAQDNFLLYSAVVDGNFEATVCVKNGDPIAPDSKAGLMVRSSTSNDAAFDFLYTSNAGTSFQFRQTAGQTSFEKLVQPPPDDVIWYKFKRIGADLMYYVSTDGATFSKVNTRTIGTMTVNIGPAYTSGSAANSGCATFSYLIIQMLPDIVAQLFVGVADKTRVLPTIVQQGSSYYREDLSTRNNGEPIKMSGITYSKGIGGMPQCSGTSSYLLYDLKSEASRLHIAQFQSLLGMGGAQDGGCQVAMQIKTSNSPCMPSIAEWLTPTDQVNVAWSHSISENPKAFGIDLTGVKWVGLFMAVPTMDNTHNGVWGNITMGYLGSERNPPVITTEPVDITKQISENAAFSVIVEGSLPLLYQWQKNGMDIPGANASIYVTPPVSLDDDGAVYCCVVSNTGGSETSFDAELSVVDEPNDAVSEYAIVAANSLDIRDMVKVRGGLITSNNTLAAGCDDDIVGNISAVNNITLRDRTKVTGDVKAGGSVNLGNNTQISGAVLGNQSIPTVAIEQHSVSYGVNNVTIASGATLAVSNGQYKDLTAADRSTLKLNAGIYNFKSFSVACDAKIIFNLNAGEVVEINVAGDVTVGDRTVMEINGTADHFAIKWYSNSTNTITISPDTKIFGQIIAPTALVHVFSRSIVNGLCHAKDITIEPTAVFNYLYGSSPSNQAPTVAVAAAASANPVIGLTTNLSVLGADDGGEGNLTYTWEAVTVPNFAWVNFSNNGANASKNTAATFSGPGSYTVRVTIEDQYLVRTSSVVTITVNTISAAPSALIASAASSSQLDLTWTDNSSNETGFYLERAIASAGPFTQIASVGADNIVYSSTGLTANTSYWYRIRSYNALGNSAYSNTATATTLNTIPTAPTALTAAATSSLQINLTWTDNSSNEGGFSIECSLASSGPFTQIGSVAANVKVYSTIMLSEATAYWFRVQAFNNGGNSAYTNTANATTPYVAPDAPRTLMATAASSSQIELAWTDYANNETGFYIERATASAGPFTQIASIGANIEKYSNTGLTSNTNYWYRVRAYNAVGNSAYSNTANAITLNTMPAAPTALSATAVSSCQINLSWTDNATNETGFYVYRNTSSTKPGAATVSLGANAATYCNTGLSANTTYYYWVCAYNNGGNSTDATANTTTQIVTPIERLTNTTFTTNLNGWTTQVAAPACGTITWNAYNGGQVYCNMTAKGTNRWDSRIYQNVNVTTGKTYEVSADLRLSAAGNQTVYLVIEKNSAPNTKYVDRTIALTSATFATYTGQYTATASEQILVQVMLGATNGNVRVDNFSLIER
jgi:predicted acyltransferase (DUF342 family)